ncbi:MAG: ABC transporter permease subunit [Lentisphaerota bacterium]
MIRFLLRRILQMIPTVLGVILITFILFNVVGGSPASMTLGKYVSAKALEEFDEQRGFNKPLIMGRWTKTRALEDSDFTTSPGAWRKAAGVVWNDGVSMQITNGSVCLVPLSFPLYSNTTYRLTLEYRLDPEATAVCGYGRVTDGISFPTNECFCFSILADVAPLYERDEESGARRARLHNNKTEGGFSNDWKKAEIVFQSLENPVACKLALRVEGGGLELRSARLRREAAHWWDSQLVFYFKQIARLDFGMSSSMNQPVSRLLKQGILPSLALTVPIFLIELVLSVVLALVCAFFRDSWLDRLLVVVSVALMSINYLVWIVAGQYVLAFKLGWFPVWGFASWSYLLLPVLIGVVSGLGVDVRFYRTIMLDEMYKDYVRTAFAKGVSRSGVLFKHVLKNAMIPIVTNVVIAIPFLYTGSLLLESFFGIPGLGYMSVNAINSSDVDVVRAIVLIGSILFVGANLVTDLCYAWLDPRVKLE